MKILLTGFEAFGGEAINPSWMVAKALHGKVIQKHRVLALQLPTVFQRSQLVLAEAISTYQPSLVICLGQAGGRHAISIERVAINVDDARMADNDGEQPIDKAIFKRAPAAYFSRLPIKAILATLVKASLPAEISNSVGTFVCNHVFYVLMHQLRKQNDVRAGFIHIPYLPEQAAKQKSAPSMALADLIRGIELAIAVSLSQKTDIELAAGSIC